MSKQNKKDDLYSNIELIPDEAIKDTDSEQGFEVDWDIVEEKYAKHNHHHSHHHSSHQHSSEHSSEHKHSSEHSSEHKHSSEHRHSSGNHNSRHSARHHSSDRSKKPSGKSKKKWSKKKKILVGILIFILCLIIGTVAAFFILRNIGKNAMLNYDNLNINVPDGVDYENNGEFVYYKGHKYQFNKKIASILFMGIDNRSLKDKATPGTAGQADALYLFTYNTDTGYIKVLSLNRDSMVDISRYDEHCNYYDTTKAQLCLAYAYGDGKSLSAENQVTAVERMLYNVPINGYYAIDLDAIKILNDDIGGVTLTPEYTFGSFTKGQTITIKGDMAEEFVRHRDTSLLDDNTRRMACQRLYINSFANQIVPAIKKDLGVAVDLYNHSSSNTTTNISTPILTYLASTLATNYNGLNMVNIKGKYYDNPKDEFAEYIVKKKSLFKTVLDLFYTQID